MLSSVRQGQQPRASPPSPGDPARPGSTACQRLTRAQGLGGGTALGGEQHPLPLPGAPRPEVSSRTTICALRSGWPALDTEAADKGCRKVVLVVTRHGGQIATRLDGPDGSAARAQATSEAPS